MEASLEVFPFIKTATVLKSKIIEKKIITYKPWKEK